MAIPLMSNFTMQLQLQANQIQFREPPKKDKQLNNKLMLSESTCIHINIHWRANSQGLLYKAYGTVIPSLYTHLAHQTHIWYHITHKSHAHNAWIHISYALIRMYNHGHYLGLYRIDYKPRVAPLLVIDPTHIYMYARKLTSNATTKRNDHNQL